jgi:hypothetical protein
VIAHNGVEPAKKKTIFQPSYYHAVLHT